MSKINFKGDSYKFSVRRVSLKYRISHSTIRDFSKYEFVNTL